MEWVRLSRAPSLCAALLAGSGALLGGQSPDTAYARLVREATSDTRFLPASVASLPDHPTIPSPRDHFGTIVGAPGIMHRSSEIYAYYRALAAATPRLHVETIGRTEEGREIVLVIVADEGTMARLNDYRARTARLADPRSLPAAELEDVLTQAKPIYYLNGGLHSPEMGSPEMLMELAYRLAVSDEPEIRAIRAGVITLINPVSEPDGRDRQVDWYHRYTKQRTEWDDGFPRSSPYWGKYVFHDNNRDGIQISQELTKAVYREYFRWHPTVMLDLHESIPLLYVSTGTGPYNETIDPLTIAEWQLLANHDVTALTAQGQPGVWTWGFYDGWWPGYLLWIANNHNGIGRFYETFGNAGANTFVRDLSNQRYAGDSATSRQWYRAWPPTRKLRWSARDNVNYMQAGVLASLGYAATNGPALLRNFWQKGMNNVERGRRERPHAFAIPGLARQRDPRRTAYLVNQLRRHGIEVHRRAAGDSAGDFVVLLNQPYRNLAVTLLGKQDFPQNAPQTPYDDVAWTLGLVYGVDVRAVDDTAVFTWSGLEPLTDTVAAAGALSGEGSVYVVAHRAQSELLPALYWLRGSIARAGAWAAESAFVADGDTFPAGSLMLEGLGRATADELARRYSLDLRATAAAPAVPRHRLDLPRVAIYHTWLNTQDEGWARFTFEQLGLPYTSI
ncbi:MAG: M14 family zinc carboxypeptidase, partial [Gemmatimonadales bacterium]